MYANSAKGQLNKKTRRQEGMKARVHGTEALCALTFGVNVFPFHVIPSDPPVAWESSLPENMTKKQNNNMLILLVKKIIKSTELPFGKNLFWTLSVPFLLAQKKRHQRKHVRVFCPKIHKHGLSYKPSVCVRSTDDTPISSKTRHAVRSEGSHYLCRIFHRRFFGLRPQNDELPVMLTLSEANGEASHYLQKIMRYFGCTAFRLSMTTFCRTEVVLC